MHFINFQFEYDMHVHNHQSPRIQSAWLISVYEDGCFTRNWIYGDVKALHSYRMPNRGRQHGLACFHFYFIKQTVYSNTTVNKQQTNRNNIT